MKNYSTTGRTIDANNAWAINRLGLSDTFEISTTGIITLKSGASLDHETTPNYLLVATAYNSAGASLTADINISINNLTNETPPTVTTNEFTILVNDDQVDVAFKTIKDLKTL